MDRNGRVVKSYRHDPRRPASLSNDEVRAVLEDRAGNLWVGTEDGLDLLNRASGTFDHYRHDESDAGSLRDSFVMSLYRGFRRPGLDRNEGGGRQPLESPQLGARRPPAGLACRASS